MKYATGAELSEIDRCATENFGIPSLVLMENAAIAFVDEILKFKSRAQLKCIYILSGKGNNGGDGFAIARHLYNKNFRVKVIYFQDRSTMKTDAMTNFLILEKLKVDLIRYPDQMNLEKLKRSLKTAGLIVDAIFGIGLTRGQVEEPFKSAIEVINLSKRPVISVDVPSGLNADTGEVMGSCVKADRTVTFTFLKKGFSFPKSGPYTGKIIVRDISIPRSLLDAHTP